MLLGPQMNESQQTTQHWDSRDGPRPLTLTQSPLLGNSFSTRAPETSLISVSRFKQRSYSRFQLHRLKRLLTLQVTRSGTPKLTVLLLKRIRLAGTLSFILLRKLSFRTGYLPLHGTGTCLISTCLTTFQRYMPVHKHLLPPFKTCTYYSYVR